MAGRESRDNLYWSDADRAWRVEFRHRGRSVRRRFQCREEAVAYRDTMRVLTVRALALRDVRRLFGGDAEGEDAEWGMETETAESEPVAVSAAKIGGVR